MEHLDVGAAIAGQGIAIGSPILFQAELDGGRLVQAHPVWPATGVVSGSWHRRRAAAAPRSSHSVTGWAAGRAGQACVATSSGTRGDAMNQSPELLRPAACQDRMDHASHEDWPVARLAEVSAVSPAHFARSFKQAFGLPPHRYLLSRRIERAVAMLRDTSCRSPRSPPQTGWSSLGPSGASFVTSPATARHVRARARARRRRPACRNATHVPAAGPEHRSFGEAPPRGVAGIPPEGGPMTNTVNTVGLYVRDQDEALAFYVGTLGFEVRTDVRNGLTAG